MPDSRKAINHLQKEWNFGKILEKPDAICILFERNRYERHDQITYREAYPNRPIRDVMQKMNGFFLMGEDVKLWWSIRSELKAFKWIWKQIGFMRWSRSRNPDSGQEIGAANLQVRSPIVEVMTVISGLLRMDQIFSIIAADTFSNMSGGQAHVPVVIRNGFGIGRHWRSAFP